MQIGVARLIGAVLTIMFLSSSVPSSLASGELLAESSLPNGSQTLLADPVRQLMYHADFSGDALEFLDSNTGSVIETVSVGLGPSSIAMSGNGSLLYVALSAELSIAVVDIESRSVVRDIYLGFAPFSVAVGRPDRLYVSSVQDPDWRVVDELDGTVLKVVTGTYCPLLEASPDGDTLIAADCNMSPVKVKKYRISTDNPSLMAEDDHDLGSYLQQYVVDWSGGVIYMASGAPYGIETISLADISLTGLMVCDAYTAGVALSPDRSIIYAMHSNPYDSAIWLYTPGGVLLNSLPLSRGDYLYLEVTGDENGLFIVSPLQRIPIAPCFGPGVPGEGAVLAYTPSIIEATFVDGLLPVDDGSISMSVDGTDMVFEITYTGLLRVTISSFMDEGPHLVNVSAPWYGETIWSEWTFVIDPEDPLALRPVLSPIWPTPNGTLSWPPDSISASITEPDPPPTYTSASFRLNDTLDIPATIFGEIIYADLDIMLQPGTHSLDVFLWYDFDTRVSTASWSFVLSKYQLVIPEMTPVFPSPGSVLYEPPEYIELDLDFGDPEIEVLWLNVSLDGRSLGTEQVDDDTFRGTVTYQLTEGEHDVTVQLVWDIGTIQLNWRFYLILPWELEDFEHHSGFSVPVPVGWTMVLDQKDEDGVTELEASGPTLDSITATLVVDTEKDRSLEESREYMAEQIDMTLEALASEGINAHIGWVLYRDVGGQFGVVYLIDLWQVDATALAAVAVDDESGQFWMIMLIFSSYQFLKANATFTAILDGFEVTITPPLSGLATAIVAAVVVAAVVAPMSIYIYTERRRRSAGGAGVAKQGSGESLPMVTTGHCSFCGATQPLSNSACIACGRMLPSPPFGKVVSVPEDRGRI